MTLDELSVGQTAMIDTVSGEGPVVQRLMALGLLEGSEVTVTRKALGGDPIEIEIMGYALSLRLAEAGQVHITTGGDTDSP
jgi:ferrous iron transport protein B